MKNYYAEDKHLYMHYRDGMFSDYIHFLLADKNVCDFKNCTTVIEFGAGMGRFSYSLVENFKEVYLVEPVSNYAAMLDRVFEKRNVKVFNMTAKDFLKQNHVFKNPAVFAFHLLHHLTYEERRDIFNFVKKTGAKAVFVEPNPYNPLVMLQIILNSDMKIGNEISYLKMTRKLLMEELKSSGIHDIRYLKLCFFPPALTNIILRFFLKKFLVYFEKLNNLTPFFGSYHAIFCEGG